MAALTSQELVRRLRVALTASLLQVMPLRPTALLDVAATIRPPRLVPVPFVTCSSMALGRAWCSADGFLMAMGYVALVAAAVHTRRI